MFSQKSFLLSFFPSQSGLFYRFIVVEEGFFLPYHIQWRTKTHLAVLSWTRDLTIGDTYKCSTRNTTRGEHSCPLLDSHPQSHHRATADLLLRQRGHREQPSQKPQAQTQHHPTINQKYFLLNKTDLFLGSWSGTNRTGLYVRLFCLTQSTFLLQKIFPYNSTSATCMNN